MKATVKIGNKIRKMPGDWNELSSGFRVFAIRVLLTNDENVAKIIIMRKLLRIKKSLFTKINEAQMYDLVQLLDWLHLQKLTIPIYPELKIKTTIWQKLGIHKPTLYKCPNDKMENATAYQYAAASDHYKEYIATHEKKHLDRLLATLYTDVRDDEEIKKTAKIFKNVPILVKMSALVYFAGVQYYVYENYKEWLFESDSETQGGINFGWWGKYIEIAESGVFGDLDKVYASRFYDIIVFLIQKKEAYLAQKSKMEAK